MVVSFDMLNSIHNAHILRHVCSPNKVHTTVRVATQGSCDSVNNVDVTATSVARETFM